MCIGFPKNNPPFSGVPDLGTASHRAVLIAQDLRDVAQPRLSSQDLGAENQGISAAKITGEEGKSTGNPGNPGFYQYIGS